MLLQSHLTLENMTKKGKNKAKMTEEDPEIEIVPQTEIVYEDMKSVTGAEPELKWGKIYYMLRDKKVLDSVLEDMKLFDNIL